MSLKTLLLDIETAPNTAYVWGLFDQNIAHDQVEESSYVLCWSAKWLGEKLTQFSSVQYCRPKAMLTKIHALLEQAEIVVHYNGRKFDIPTLNKEFIKYNMLPPSPYKQIDLYREIRKTFRFESNKLDAITKYLGLGRKTKHKGFELWVGCMRNEPKCWAIMEKYNRKDVALLEHLYYRLLPWMPTKPHVGILVGKQEACPSCGVLGKLHSRGKSIARTLVYQRFQCQACGSWCRSRLSDNTLAPVYV